MRLRARQARVQLTFFTRLRAARRATEGHRYLFFDFHGFTMPLFVNKMVNCEQFLSLCLSDTDRRKLHASAGDVFGRSDPISYFQQPYISQVRKQCRYRTPWCLRLSWKSYLPASKCGAMLQRSNLHFEPRHPCRPELR
jgi:hypothetical protein